MTKQRKELADFLRQLAAYVEHGTVREISMLYQSGAMARASLVFETGLTREVAIMDEDET